jgi:hypothetical protein
MTKNLLAACVAALLLLVAPTAGAFADDPTGVLMQERGQQPKYPGRRLPAFTDGGPCYQGMHQQAFPNTQGYRCYRDNLR